MNFPPRPDNDFLDFARCYYEASRRRCPQIEALTGKWTLRDLSPGLSDLDSRLLLQEDLTPLGWCQLSTDIGEAHLELCRQYPHWVRNFEHLPGVALTWAEMTAPRTYTPEYHQWAFYCTDAPDKAEAVAQTLRTRPWDETDEFFYLTKFCAYYGRYDRAIDPPINLGEQAVKYPLHSRIMHYFCPLAHAAACLLERRNLAGKLEGLEVAESHFPRLSCWKLLHEILDAHYETPPWYQEPAISELDDTLESALREMAEGLQGAVTLIPSEAGADIAAWKRALQAIPTDPVQVIFDRAKFARLMKGRLQFYIAAPPHFDATWLIQNELGRIGLYFFRIPFAIYWKLRTGEVVEDPTRILDALRGELLTDADVEATREFARLTAGTWEAGRERETAAAVVEVFDPFFVALSKISAAVY